MKLRGLFEHSAEYYKNLERRHVHGQHKMMAPRLYKTWKTRKIKSPLRHRYTCHDRANLGTSSNKTARDATPRTKRV